jgi:hypothetical protein
MRAQISSTASRRFPDVLVLTRAKARRARRASSGSRDVQETERNGFGAIAPNRYLPDPSGFELIVELELKALNALCKPSRFRGRFLASDILPLHNDAVDTESRET